MKTTIHNMLCCRKTFNDKLKTFQFQEKNWKGYRQFRPENKQMANKYTL